MESRWPDHTPEPGETPRWWLWGMGAAAIAALLIWSPDADEWRASLQLPDLRVPTLPAIDFTPPDTRLSQTPSVSEILGETDGPISERQAPFETCLSMLADTADALGQRPLPSVESSNDRQIAVFKFAEGDLTIMCSRADGTMSIERRP